MSWSAGSSRSWGGWGGWGGCGARGVVWECIMELSDLVVSDPEIMSGAPCFRAHNTTGRLARSVAV